MFHFIFWLLGHKTLLAVRSFSVISPCARVCLPPVWPRSTPRRSWTSWRAARLQRWQACCTGACRQPATPAASTSRSARQNSTPAGWMRWWVTGWTWPHLRSRTCDKPVIPISSFRSVQSALGSQRSHPGVREVRLEVELEGGCFCHSLQVSKKWQPGDTMRVEVPFFRPFWELFTEPALEAFVSMEHSEFSKLAWV